MSLTTLSLVPTVPGGEPHGVLGVHVGNVCYAVDGGGQEETRAGSKAQSPGGPGPRGAMVHPERQWWGQGLSVV